MVYYTIFLTNNKTPKPVRIIFSSYLDKINFYNVKTNKLQKSYGMKFDDTLSPYIYTLNNNEFIYVYGTDFGIDHKQRYHKLKF